MTAHSDNLAKLTQLINFYGDKAMSGGWLPPGCTDKDVDDAAPQNELEDDTPGECEECGEPNAIWLCGPYSTGLFLCKPHLEDYLTKGRGKR